MREIRQATASRSRLPKPLRQQQTKNFSRFRFLTMKARTKFQHRVVAPAGRLLPIAAAEWAFRHTVGHYALHAQRTNTCSFDRYLRNETKIDVVRNPPCQTDAHSFAARRTKGFFSVITTTVTDFRYSGFSRNDRLLSQEPESSDGRAKWRGIGWTRTVKLL